MPAAVCAATTLRDSFSETVRTAETVLECGCNPIKFREHRFRTAFIFLNRNLLFIIASDSGVIATALHHASAQRDDGSASGLCAFYVPALPTV